MRTSMKSCSHLRRHSHNSIKMNALFAHPACSKFNKVNVLIGCDVTASHYFLHKLLSPIYTIKMWDPFPMTRFWYSSESWTVYFNVPVRVGQWAIPASLLLLSLSSPNPSMSENCVCSKISKWSASPEIVR